MAKILVVDDDPSFNEMLSSYLRRQDHEIEQAFSSQSALAAFKTKSIDLILTDFKLPDMDGLELIRIIKDEKPDMPVILITNYSDVRTAVTSIQLGAFEFITKPVNPDEMLLTIGQALQEKTTSTAAKPKTIKKASGSPEYVIGTSPQSLDLWQHLQLVAPTKMTVLILGESGTGKEYAAKMIHEKSKRAKAPFVALDCGVLSKELAASELFGHIKGAFTGAVQDKKGAFENANGGTIFLDEIGNLPYEVQVQLLRVIQERKVRRVGSEKEVDVDVRIIAATNENIAVSGSQSEFRTDLFHRLNEFELKIPALRERKEDLNEYIGLFLRQACNELEREVTGLDAEAQSIVQHYSWPGNLRELKNVIKRAVLLSTGELITPAQLPHELANEEVLSTTDTIADNAASIQNAINGTTGTDLKALQEKNEKQLILETLEKTKYNKSKTAKLLNIDRKTLYNKLTKYQIEI
ncbi:sigma-54 dependent transcriptional regulator [Reichenbachiella sp. MSK19-1]|uniref:sigma-54-dependent transcriptional regulator n=1 Tax=Reichenbachiella sp. MSK19-1 TaxID=1897631 RepID=UPI000E6C4277|nr:sigma-54 dependent transcriptional regulator [Reichenbachiella sp. MSK19-1]RJE71533.1 sigma-54-dependent Fis family transcriptional regulator [Reichenbachiella sp. MSK19-1]